VLNDCKLIICLDGLLILREGRGAGAGVGPSVMVSAVRFVGSVGSLGAFIEVIVQGRKVVDCILC
jgi:hypothetical protein